MEHNHRQAQLAATTLLILERNQAQFQVFVLKRQNRGGFLRDALVFPGGIVEPVDHENGQDPLIAAAVRETQEETGLVIDKNSLTRFSWWLTPVSEKRRFDTHFFIAPYPKGQEAVINKAEAEWGRLMTPSEILALHERNEVLLMPPTLLTLELIAGLTTLKEAQEMAYSLDAPICPELSTDALGAPRLALPSGLGLARQGFKISKDGRFS